MLNDFCWVSEEARVVSKKLSSYLLLVCPGRTYVMNFDSEDDLVGWYNILKQTLENIAKNEQKNVPPLTTGFNDSWESSDSPRSKQWYQRRVRELGSSTKLKGIIMLNDFCWVSEEARVVSKKLSSYLLLVCPGRTYVMNFDSEDDLVGWYNILKQTLENIAKNEQKNVPPLTEKVGKVGCVSRVEAVIEICVVSAVVQTVEIENRVGIQIRF
eukprot:TRINITY_DN4509_c0_g2_i26.p1 TRINITY_DN4509_c0_g2~~TRINITY_DN4509_c0_g2_i26.p1  ORF type:complete len:213 (-),score=49.44 TRINITY_DN4509_c0_g2_i26:1439-2077(-)